MSAVVFYVADQSMAEGLKTFFQRPDWHTVLGCEKFEINPYNDEHIFHVPGFTDGGVWRHAATHLANHLGRFDHAIVMLDEHFDPYPGVEKLHSDISTSMLNANWPTGSFEVIVIQPMLESWLWTDDATTASAFGVPDFAALKAQLIQEGMWTVGNPKPDHAKLKEARNRAMRMGGRLTIKVVFNDVFGYLSKRALDQCIEPGFLLLRKTLRHWFPPAPPPPIIER